MAMCPKCGAMLAAGTAVCPVCGERQENAESAVKAAQEAAMPPEETEEERREECPAEAKAQAADNEAAAPEEAPRQPAEASRTPQENTGGAARAAAAHAEPQREPAPARRTPSPFEEWEERRTETPKLGSCLLNGFLTGMPLLGSALQALFLVFGTAAVIDARAYGFWWWLPLIVLAGVSLVKLAVTVLWACGAARSPYRRQQARASLVFLAVAVLLLIALYFAVRGNLNHYLAYGMAYDYEDMILPFAPFLVP